MARRCLAVAVAFLVFMAGGVRAADPPADPKNKPLSKEEAALKQEMLAKSFRDFEQSLLVLAQRLEKSSKQADRDKAKVLKNALEFATGSGVENRFQKLIQILKESDKIGINELTDAMRENKMILASIRTIIDILLKDDRQAQRKKDRESLEQIIKDLEKAIRDEKVVRANIEAKRLEKDELTKQQEDVSKLTEKINEAIRQLLADKDTTLPAKPLEEANKHVENAMGSQKQIQGNVSQGNASAASTNADMAVADLQRARDILNPLLNRLNNQENQRLKKTLLSRLEVMLAMQVPVYDDTVVLNKKIAKNEDEQPTRADKQASLQLGDKEGEILKEANEAYKIVEESKAIAFGEVFQQMRQDMTVVQRRLNRIDPGLVTQKIETDIIDTLKEMIQALKTSLSEPEDPEDGTPPDPGPQPDKDLLDLIHELKLIRTMQLRVNERTKTYAKQYTGEQAEAADITAELKNLAERQNKISKITIEVGKKPRQKR